ncbi:MAG: efflux RND transporter permease subunit [Alphaproteobacteria bacterium]|nr:efflux RND transporter permease subunit [Alphaproteobacteria bacterium]
MTLPEFCIKRPVFATVINIFIILLGITGYTRLTIREYPNIDEPVITVQTVYSGASAEIIESQISKPLEDSLAGIEGIEVMSSVSRAERSQITLRFKLTRNPDDAASDVRDRVSRVRGQLPDEVSEPVISKVEADAQPIIYMAFNSVRHSAMEITDYADRYVKDRVQNVSGVASAIILGERRKSMRIWLDPQRLGAYKLTPQDVENAIRKQNVEIPAGRIEGMYREFTVLSETDLKTPEQFDAIILKNTDVGFVRLRDVAHSEVAPENERRVVRFNGRNAVALGVIRQSTANPLDVSKGIYEVLPEIVRSLPEGMELSVAYDTSVFIDRSIKEVYFTIAETVILVILVIFFFLRNLRSTIIPILTIPISLTGTFMIMYVLGYSLNTLTLLALVLSIGLVVDDAIVVLENIYRHIEEGMAPYKAAMQGSREIVFAVIAMTLTLAAVFTPLAFSTGKTGRLFIEFAVTLAGAVIISGIVALTLTPMLCSRIMKKEKKHGAVFNAIERFFHVVSVGYDATLSWSLRHRLVIVFMGLLIAGSGGGLFTLLKSELAPTEDRGTIITIAVGSEGSTIGYMSDWMLKLDPVFKSVPEMDMSFIVAGVPIVSQGISFIGLKPWEERMRSQQEIVAALAPKIFMATPGIMAFPINPPSLGTSPRSKEVEMVLQSGLAYRELGGIVDSFSREVTKYPGLVNVETDLKLNKPQISIRVDRDKAAAVGLDIDVVGRTLETLLGGRKVTRYKDMGEQYDVIVQTSSDLRASPQDLADIYVRNSMGEMVRLLNIISFSETVAPRELNHFNQLRAVKLTANLAPGYALGEALDWLQKAAHENLPQSVTVDFDGQSREFIQSSAGIYMTFVLALAFIYLILAAQFESFASPFIIMLSVPLSMTGALLALYLTGGTLNIYSQVGMVTLIGLITKNGILIVEFANQQREQGKKVMEAILIGANLRLRPILMTAGSLILGAVPLAMANGAGAESRHQIGWVIIGGMTVGTLFTLFVIPVVYSLVFGLKESDVLQAAGQKNLHL